tara:strand:+ start:70 stop:444 length:375 start_codon:yes stop_codon:yes gene_type:complete
MSELKLCQGPDCHQQQTKDRLKGPKDNKTFQTRRRSSFYYGDNNFCSTWCQSQWFEKFGNRAIDHFGRLKEAKKLTKENAWRKTYEWDNDYRNRQYSIVNGITKEQRPITKEQWGDNNYTLNTS